MRNTWVNYWPKILPGSTIKEIWLAEDDGDAEKAKETFSDAPWDFAGNDSEAWPEKFDQECYTDCFTRDITIRTFITDRRRHPMIGGFYQFTEEVLKLATYPK